MFEGAGRKVHTRILKQAGESALITSDWVRIMVASKRVTIGITRNGQNWVKGPFKCYVTVLS